MTDPRDMTTGEAAAYRRGLAEGYERARAQAVAMVKHDAARWKPCRTETADALWWSAEGVSIMRPDDAEIAAAMQPDTRDNHGLPRQSGDRHNQPGGQ